MFRYIISNHSIALVTLGGSGYIFLCCYIYLCFYTSNIGIPFIAFNISAIFIIEPLFKFFIFFLLAAILFSFIIHPLYILDKQTFFDNSKYPFILSLFLCLLLGIDFDIILRIYGINSNYIFYLTFALIALSSSLIWYIFSYNTNFLSKLAKREINIKMNVFYLFTLIVILISSLIFVAFIGNNYATSLIQGHPGHYEVILDLEDFNGDLENKSLILVTKSGGNFYLVEKCVSYPNNHTSCVYVVPDHAIKSAIIRKIPRSSNG